MNKEYVSLSLVSGQIILCQSTLELDLEGYMTIYDPMKPMVIDSDGNSKIVLVSINPFSDSRIYRIHRDKILFVGSMIADYIDKYQSSVDAHEESIRERYKSLLQPYNFDDYITENTNTTLQ